jgi:filamentous hemagglutinin
MSQVFVQSNLEKFRSNKRFIAQYILAFYLLSPHALLAEGLSAANTQHAPEIINAANGVPVVNVNAPSSGGVSRNEYQDFNVQQQGLILNNSPEIVDTELAGYIDGNAALTGNSASIILNEVVGDNASLLQGYTEVAGSSAEIVIANQNGITCNGCGFINTTRSTLTTGQLLFDNDAFTGFDVSRGQISIGERGFNASNLDQVDLLARSIELNGKVWANYLNTITGSNTISSDLSEVTVTNSEEDKPQVALDVAALGGMYANRIRLIGTEQGLGVNLQGDVIATSNLVIDQQGNIKNGATLASNSLEISAQGLSNSTQGNILSAENTASIILKDTLKNEGSIKGQGISIDVEKLENIGSVAVIASEQDLTINTAETNNADNALLFAKGNLNIESDDSISNNSASIESINDISLKTTNLENSGQIYSKTTVGIESSDSLVNEKGVIYGVNSLTLESDSITNKGSTIQSQGNIGITTESLTNSGQSLLLSSDGDMALSATELNNTASISAKNISIESGNLKNDGVNTSIQSQESLSILADNNLVNQNSALLTSEQLTLSVNNKFDNSGLLHASNQANLVATTLENQGTLLVTSGDLTIDTDNITNKGIVKANNLSINTTNLVNTGVAANIQSKGNLTITAEGDFTNEDGATISSYEQIVLSITGSLDNIAASIQSILGLTVESEDLDNREDSTIQSLTSDVTLSVGEANNRGRILGENLNITSESFHNDGASARLQANDTLMLTSSIGDIKNTDNGIIYALNTVQLTSASNILNKQSTIQSTGSVSASGKSIENDDASIIAKTDTLELAAENSLTNSGVIAGKGVSVASESLTNSGSNAQIQSTVDLDIETKNANNNGVIFANQNINFSVSETLENTNVIQANNSINVSGGVFDNKLGRVFSKNSDATLEVNTLNNTGVIAGQNVDITTESLTNSGSSAQIQAQKTLEIDVTTGDLINSDGGVLYSIENMILSVIGSIENTGSTIKSLLGLSINAESLENDYESALVANGDLQVEVSAYDNRGLIQGANVDVNTAAFNHSGDAAQLQAKNDLTVTVTAEDFSNQGIIYAGENLTLNAVDHKIINNDLIQAEKNITLNTTSINNVQGATILSTDGTVSADVNDLVNQGALAAQDITLTSQTFKNSGSDALIQANDTLEISVTQGDLNNESGAKLFGFNDIKLSASQAIDNITGFIQSAYDATLSALSFNNDENSSVLSQNGTLDIQVENLNNQGAVVANDMNLASNTFSNSGASAQIQASNDLTVTVSQGDISNTDQAVMYAGNNVTLTSVNNAHNIVNNNAVIQAGNQTSLHAKKLENTNNGAIATQVGVLTIDVTDFHNTALIAGHSVDVDTDTFLNSGAAAQIQADTSLAVTSTGDITNTAGALLYSQDSATLTTQGKLDNQSSNIKAIGAIDIFSAQLINSLNAMIVSQYGALNITTTNDSYNQGVLAGKYIDIKSNGFVNTGDKALVQATSQLSITSESAVSNQNDALIYSQGSANIEASSDFNNVSAVVETGEDLTITASTIYNQQGSGAGQESAYLVSSGDMNINGTLRNLDSVIQSLVGFTHTNGTFYNNSNSVLKAMNGTANFDSTYWYNYGFMGADNLTISASSIKNSGDSALVLALDHLSMTTTGRHLDNSDGGVLYSVNSADFDVAGTLINEGSLIETGGILNIKASKISNKREDFVVDYDTELTDSVTEESISRTELPNPPASNRFWYANISYEEYTTTPYVVEEGVQGMILSGSDMTLETTQGVYNYISTISSAGGLNIKGGTLQNLDYSADVTVVQNGIYKWGTWKECGWHESCGHKDRKHYSDDYASTTTEKVTLASAIISANGDIIGSDLDTLINGADEVDSPNSQVDDSITKVDETSLQQEQDVTLKDDDAALTEVAQTELAETQSVEAVEATDLTAVDNDVAQIESDTIAEVDGAVDPADPSELTVDFSDANLDDLSNGALFSQTDNNEHNYLIETNPHFTEYQNFISSDYMLERMGLDVDEADSIRLGDGYFEQDLVRDQVLDLTGEQYINDYENTEEQYLALMDNALEAQNDLDLSLGVALTAEQIQSLNKPIVWLVEQEFETENGIQVALVPQVYFTNAMQMLLREDGALIAGENVDLEVKEALANSGSIKAEEKLKLVAEDIKNTGKIEASQQIDLIAQRDIINQSGTIDGGSVTIKAGRDFINETKVEIIDINSGNYSGKQSLIDDIATINADELTIISGNDVQLIGSDINVENDLVIQAVNDIEISTAKILEEAISGKYYNVSSTQHITTEIGAGTVLMLAGETFTSEGANIQATGSLDISAKDIELLAVKNTEDKDLFMNYGGGNTKHVQSHSESVVGTQLNTTGVLRLTSENDIFSKGTDLVGGQGIALNAGGSILLATEEAFNSSRVDTTSKKSGVTGSTRKKSTYISESLTNTGTTLTSDGNIVIASGADVVLHGTDVSAGEHVAIDAAGDLLVTAAIDNFYEHYTKTKKGSISQSAKNVGSKTKEAVATNLTAGGSMSINSGGNVAVVGSNLTAKDTLTIGNSIIAKDESGNTLQNENGQFVNESGEQVGNVTLTTQELTNEEWHEESSGLRGVFKDIAGGLSFVAGSFGIDAEIEVGRSTETRTKEVTQDSSNLQANNLGIDVQGDVAIVGSNVNVGNLASINANSVTLDAAQEQATQHHSETVTTMSSAGPSLGEDEVTVGSISKTDQTESTTTESTTWKGSSLNAGTLIVNTDEAVSIISSDINVAGDTSIKAEDVLISGRQDETTTTNTSKTKIETVSLGIKNAYADTAFAIKALNDAKNAARDAEDAYQDARGKVDAGLMLESELRYFETNMAAAAANVANATLAVASASATAAATTGTGGFYATGSASVETSESSSTNTDKTWNGSNLNIGGHANLSAENSLEVKGSNIAVAGGLQLDAKDINLLAGENSSNTSSESSSHSESASYSTSGGPSGSVSADKSESSSEAHYYTNTQIVAGTLSSDSENLTLSGANVDAGVVDITTETLLVESLQNTFSSNSKSEGANVGIGSGGISSGGINQQKSESSSAWVDQQSGITGGAVNVKAKDATFKGGVIAAVDENGNDNGQLSFATDTLTVEDIQDHDTSSDKGFSLNASAGSTTVGGNYSGHDTRQTTKATIGSGNVTVGGEALADTDIDVNRDVDNAQEITQDHELGGLDASVTLDHRVLTEEGRQSISNDFEDTAEHAQDIARTTEKLYEDENLNILNFGETLHNNASATQLKNDLARNPENAEILAGLQSDDPEKYAQAVEDLGHLAQEKFGLELSEIGLYNADETSSASLGDNALVDVKGGTVVDKDHAQAGNIFIDVSQNDDGSEVAKTDMMNTLGHEVLETQDFQGKDSSLTGGLFGTNTDDQQESLANAFGEQFSDRINQATGDTLDSSGGENFNQNLRNSQAVASGTKAANSVGSADVEYRQLNLNESLRLDSARKAIISGPGTDAEKAIQLSNLNALACAAVKCAAGVSEDDPNYQVLADLQAKGESLNENTGADIKDMLKGMGISTEEVVTYGRGNLKKSEELFDYDLGDEAQDIASKADKFVQIVDKSVDAAAHVAIEAVAPVVDVVESTLNVNEDASFKEHMREQTAKSIDEMVNAESEVGQRVIDSFSADTHEEAPNYALGAAVTLVGSAVPAVKAVDKAVDKAGMATLEAIADKLGPKLDDSLPKAIQKSSNKSPDKVEYDVDSETGFDTLEIKRKVAEENRKAHQEKMADTVAHTGDNKHVDLDEYERLQRANKAKDEKPGDKSKKGALAEGVRKILKDLGELE